MSSTIKSFNKLFVDNGMEGPPGHPESGYKCCKCGTLVRGTHTCPKCGHSKCSHCK